MPKFVTISPMTTNYSVINGAYLPGMTCSAPMGCLPLSEADPETEEIRGVCQRVKMALSRSISDICRVSMRLKEGPIKPPEVIERDSKRVQERHGWVHRIQMLQTAYETDGLYSLSVVPSSPRELQTLFISKYRTPTEIKEEIKEVTECRTSAFLKAPPKVGGLLKPWDGYNSAKFGVDPVFNSSTPILLTAARDIPDTLSDKMQNLLLQFLLDVQSRAIGIIMIEAGKPSYHVYEKALLSSSTSQ